MIQTKEKKINGVEYSVVQFPARHGLKIKAELVKLFAPSLFSLAGNLDAKVNSETLGPVIQGLCDRLHPDDMVDLALRLLANTRREGKELTTSVFDDVFAGSFDELYKALAFVIEVNYGSFFQSLGIGNLADKLDKLPKPKKA